MVRLDVHLLAVPSGRNSSRNDHDDPIPLAGLLHLHTRFRVRASRFHSGNRQRLLVVVHDGQAAFRAVPGEDAHEDGGVGQDLDAWLYDGREQKADGRLRGIPEISDRFALDVPTHLACIPADRDRSLAARRDHGRKSRGHSRPRKFQTLDGQRRLSTVLEQESMRDLVALSDAAEIVARCRERGRAGLSAIESSNPTTENERHKNAEECRARAKGSTR